MEYRDVTNHQRGGLSEALVTSHWYEIYDVFSIWAVDDLHTHENEPVTSPDDVRIKFKELEQWDTRHAGKNDEYSWVPDCCYEVQVATRQTDLGNGDRIKMGPPNYDYLFEIKTGEYGSLKRDQRDVMVAIEATEENIIPVRVRIDLKHLPEQYGIHFTRVCDGH